MHSIRSNWKLIAAMNILLVHWKGVSIFRNFYGSSYVEFLGLVLELFHVLLTKEKREMLIVIGNGVWGYISIFLFR